MHSGKTLPAKTPHAMLENSVELMRARYRPESREFWLFNSRVPINSLEDESYVMAKLYYNKEKKQFVLKNRYCTYCTTQGHYFCDE